MSKTLEIAKKLISIESITPNDNGCIDLIESELASLISNLKDLIVMVFQIYMRNMAHHPLY